LDKVGDWNRFTENAIGTLVEKCCHFFDLMNLVLDSEPVRVMASGAQDVNHLDESFGGRTHDILDNAYVIVEYSSGQRGLLDLCMFAEANTSLAKPKRLKRSTNPFVTRVCIMVRVSSSTVSLPRASGLSACLR
jgi:predicted dehydrogenase